MYNTALTPPSTSTSTPSPSSSSPEGYGQVVTTTTTTTTPSYASTTTPYHRSSGTSSPTRRVYPTQQYAGTATTMTSPYQPTSASSSYNSAMPLPTRLAPPPPKYRHNAITACWLLPCLCMMLSSHASPWPAITCAVMLLLWYGLDLAAARQALLYAVWLSVLFGTFTTGWFWLLEADDDAVNASGTLVLVLIVRMAVAALVLVCTACWTTLQLEWLLVPENGGTTAKEQQQDSGDGNSLPRQMEGTLHAVGPAACAGMASHLITSWWQENGDEETAVLCGPLLFAALFSAACLSVGSCISSFPKHGGSNTTGGTATTTAAVAVQPANGHDDGNSSDADSSSATKDTTRQDDENRDFIVRGGVAAGHVWLLLLVPPVMFLCTSLSRLISWRSDIDDWYDLILSCTVPYLLYCGMQQAHATKLLPNPYAKVLRKNSNSNASTLLGAAVPMTCSLLVSIAVQQRFLVPWSMVAAHKYFAAGGTTAGSGGTANVWMVTLYWTGATGALYAACWLWGRLSTVTNQPLLGEYHDDVVQLCLAVAGLCAGKAFGLPWSFTPLPILGCLGLALWFTSRMFRYLAIFLFVVHSAGVVLFTYRFAGIADETLTLPLTFLPRIGSPSLGLTRFGMLALVTSIAIGCVAGLAVRSTGGLGAALLRRFDVPGLLLIAYSFALFVLEVTLLKRAVPTTELVGMQDVAAEEADQQSAGEQAVYAYKWAWLTAFLLAGLALFLRKIRVTGVRTTITVVCLAAGKAVAVYLDATERASVDGMLIRHQQDDAARQRHNTAAGARIILRACIAAVVGIVMFAPRVFLEPVHVKSGRSSRRSSPNGKYHGAAAAAGGSGSELPHGTTRTIMLYAFVFLPLALAPAIPYVLFPLANALSIRSSSGYYGYYNTNTNNARSLAAVSELAGWACALWGLACLSMLNYYLPDSGSGQAYKKLAALTFLMGIGLVLCAPTAGGGGGGGGSTKAAFYNPYVLMSSAGSELLRRRKSRTGGWGLLLAGLATLLAIAGPLELRERPRSNTAAGGGGNKRDSYLLLRTMIFSVMFGCGVAWFVILQTLSDTAWIFLVCTAVACMVVSFLGTVAAVLGYFLELEHFDEAEQVGRVFLLACPLFLPLTAVQLVLDTTSLEEGGVRPLGEGGWLSTYLMICSLSLYSFCLAVRGRGDKNERTRGTANASCLLAWILAMVVLCGRYGVSGLDANYNVTTVFGLSATIFGTLVLSPMLLALEGESSSQSGTGKRKNLSRVKLTSSSSKKSPPGSGNFLLLNLPQLKRSNRWVPPVAGTVLVFLLASLYVIFVRGCGFWTLFGGDSVAKSHADVFVKVFGNSKKLLNNAAGAAAAILTKEDRDLAAMAERTVAHHTALAAAAKLAASGFWTSSDSFVRPAVHAAGVLAALPSLYLALVVQYWQQGKASVSHVTAALPLNLIPLIICGGIAPLRVAALIGCVVGIFQRIQLQRMHQRSRMRI